MSVIPIYEWTRSAEKGTLIKLPGVTHRLSGPHSSAQVTEMYLEKLW
jgi:hypothetical protein